MGLSIKQLERSHLKMRPGTKPSLCPFPPPPLLPPSPFILFLFLLFVFQVPSPLPCLYRTVKFPFSKRLSENKASYFVVKSFFKVFVQTIQVFFFFLLLWCCEKFVNKVLENTTERERRKKYKGEKETNETKTKNVTK